MITFRLQRKLAAEVMNCGQNRVWFNPTRLEEIKGALTKEDIRNLIKDGAIKKRPVIGIKRRAGRKRERRRKKGRKRKIGRKRLVPKERKRDYIIRIRNIRRYLKVLKKTKKIDSKQFKKLNKLAKAGIIKNKQDIMERLR